MAFQSLLYYFVCPEDSVRTEGSVLVLAAG